MSGVPDDLMQRLHEANQAFRQVSERLAEVDEMSLAERNMLAQSVRIAEREIEALTEEINQILNLPPFPPESSQPGSGL